MKNTYNYVTRVFDVVLALIAILFLGPLLLFVVILLRLTGEKEIFYNQERIGLNGEKFSVLKFATMLKHSPNIGSGAITIRNDPRVLPVGRVLRKTKINELPQLFNILKGDMSFVGPRPLMEKQFNFYNQNEKDIIGRMRPGLTGVGSIIFRDEESYFEEIQDPDKVYKEIIAPAKGLLEVWYFRNCTIRLYFMIIIITAIAVIFPWNYHRLILDSNTSEALKHVLSRSR